MRPKGPNYTVPTDEEILGYNNVPVEVAARYIGASTATLYEALPDERAPFGFAVLRASNWSYNISPGGLIRYKREGLQMLRLSEIQAIAVEGIQRLLEQRGIASA